MCIHANRFIVHVALQQIANNEWFNTTVVNKNDIRVLSHPLVDTFVSQVTQIINELFPESYPANIFKNITKCRAVEERINTSE